MEITTKLFAPSINSKTVKRKRLLDKLNCGFNEGGSLTLISAPAGYGKTTLAAEWLSGLNRSFAWLSLDIHDNDPVRFFTYMISSLQIADKSVGISAKDILGSLNMLSKETLMNLLIKDIASIAPLIMVF